MLSLLLRLQAGSDTCGCIAQTQFLWLRHVRYKGTCRSKCSLEVGSRRRNDYMTLSCMGSCWRSGQQLVECRAQLQCPRCCKECRIECPKVASFHGWRTAVRPKSITHCAIQLESSSLGNVGKMVYQKNVIHLAKWVGFQCGALLPPIAAVWAKHL